MPHPFQIFQQAGNYHISEGGHLLLHATDLVALAQGRERPLYVLDEVKIRDNLRRYHGALARHYPGPTHIYYASKALQNLALCVLMQQERVGLDVCSLGEMAVATKAGIPFSEMILHGNNKSAAELEQAIHYGIHRIIIDSAAEADLVEQICQKLQKKCSVLVRLNPEIQVSSHKHIVTGVKTSKFGIPLGEESLQLIRQLKSSEFISFKGIHYHIGSQIFVLKEFVEALSLMLDYLGALKNTHNIVCEDLNIGGGIGVRYLPQDVPLEVEEFVQAMTQEIIQKAAAYGLPLPCLMLEPGRSIIAEAGCTLYQIGTLKDVGAGLSYAAVNGGMTDNLRPALYQAAYFGVAANKMQMDAKTYPYKIVGKCCESGDVLLEKIDLPFLETGDILAVFSTGAYNASLANNYNKHPLPGMVLVGPAGYAWIQKDQPLEDLTRYDLLPPHLSVAG